MSLENFPVSVNESDIDARLEYLQQRGRITSNGEPHFRHVYRGVLSQYRRMHPRLDVSDPYVARLCQVLTDNGLKTTESCQGHPERNKLPFVLFYPNADSSLQLVTSVVHAQAALGHFHWGINSLERELPGGPAAYWLKPETGFGANLHEIHPLLLQDIDFIALSFLTHSVR